MSSSHFSRRSFLRSTLAAGVAPLLLPSRGWAAETAPNSRITLGFIGCGIQSRGLLGGFLGKKNTQTVAVCDVDATRRENHKKMVDDHYAKAGNADGSKGCASYNDFRELLARKDIDAVVIATPDHWHAIIGIAAPLRAKTFTAKNPSPRPSTKLALWSRRCGSISAFFRPDRSSALHGNFASPASSCAMA